MWNNPISQYFRLKPYWPRIRPIISKFAEIRIRNPLYSACGYVSREDLRADANGKSTVPILYGDLHVTSRAGNDGVSPTKSPCIRKYFHPSKSSAFRNAYCAPRNIQRTDTSPY